MGIVTALLVPFAAGAAMFAGDVLAAMYVMAISKGRNRLAGHLDGLQDLTQVVSIGGGVSAVFAHDAIWTAVLTLALIYVGSVAGAEVGGRLSTRFVKTGVPA